MTFHNNAFLPRLSSEDKTTLYQESLFSLKKTFFTSIFMLIILLRYCFIDYINTIKYNTIRYETIQYDTIQYNTIQ